MRAGWVRETGSVQAFDYWSDIWRGNPHIAPRTAPPTITRAEWEKLHGYVDHTLPGRYVYRDGYRALRGEIHLEAAEIAWAENRVMGDNFVVVEPHIKGLVGADNRDWGWANWQALVDGIPGRVVQLGRPGLRSLDGVERIETPSFRLACAVLRFARCLVATNGGLHHAAAALKIPAVVIWGGYNDPKILGYPDHVNIYEPHQACLGQRQSSRACRLCMERIKVERVLEALCAVSSC